MKRPYKLLERNHYLSTQIGLVKEWSAQDTVAFSQLVDFTAVESERDLRKKRDVESQATRRSSSIRSRRLCGIIPN